MSERNLLIPILLVVVVGAPIVYHEMKSKQSASGPTESPADWSNQDQSAFSLPQANSIGTGVRAQTAGYSQPADSRHVPTRNISRPNIVPAEQPFQFSGDSKTSGNPVDYPATKSTLGTNLFDPNTIPVRASERNNGLANVPSHSMPIQSAPITPFQPAADPVFNLGTSIPQPLAQRMAVSPPIVKAEQIDFSKMTPDYGAAETLIYPGNEFGPDLTAEPLEHLPVQDFGEIFQFDLTKAFVQRRWKRISTNPMDFQNELSGMRIPLVTGTNTWDLHGSLTYYFDTQQQLQRITFRGWTGDPKKLLNCLTSKYQLKAQPTTLAGFYLGENRRKTHGGIMLKTPSVIDANNRFQQYGIVLEMNRPEGPFELSDEYRRLIAGSHPK